MDKFDQWYNKKLDEQDVAYSESSWETFSQQLNQLPGSKKRRRPFIFIWILALCVIAGAGSIFAWQAYNNPSSKEDVLISTEDDHTPVKPVSDEQSDESKVDNAESQPLAANVDPESATENSKAEVLNSGRITELTGNKKKLVQPNSKQNQKETTDKSPALLQPASNQKEDTDRPEAEVAQSNIKASNSTAQNSIAQTKSSEKSASVVLNDPETKSIENSGTELTKETVSSSQAAVDAMVGSDQMSASQVIDPLGVEIKSLELRAYALPQSSLLSNDLHDLEPTIVACCTYKGWSHHAELGAQFFPGVNEGSRFFTGLQAAYHLQYRWAQRWSASAGGGFVQRWGNFGGFQDSPQNIYTSQKVRRGYLLVPTSATYLQVPLMINFHAGKHLISAGIRTHLLLGVKGQLDEYLLQRDGQQADLSFNSNTVNTGWINESGFRTIVPEYMLAYGYQLNSHWAVSISAAWMPNGIAFAEKTEESQNLFDSLVAQSDSKQQPFLLEDKWQVGVSLRYKF